MEETVGDGDGAGFGDGGVDVGDQGDFGVGRGEADAVVVDGEVDVAQLVEAVSRGDGVADDREAALKGGLAGLDAHR